jgi:DUF1680 family protein
MFELFPDEAKVLNSEAFVERDFLGYPFFQSVYTVKYQPRELLFVIRLDSAPEARRLAQTYLHALHLPPDSTGASMLDVADPVNGNIGLLVQGRYLCGSVGPKSREDPHWMLGLMKARITDLELAATRVTLPTLWRFSTGDDRRYLTVGFDDSGWKSIRDASWWETQGYDGYDGIGWYRTKVSIPSSMRRAASIGDALLICLGRMDDGDTTYFNGVNIGHTDVAGPIRKYLVPLSLVRWDEENTIAVRVEDVGGAGGLGVGPYYIKPAASAECISIRAGGRPLELEPAEIRRITETVNVSPLRPVSISGRVGVRVENINTRIAVLDTSWHCVVGGGSDTSFQYGMTLRGSGTYRALYSFVPDSLGDTVHNSAILAHVPFVRATAQPVQAVVRPVNTDRARSIPYGRLRLGGYLEERITANLRKRLLKIDEDGMLSGFLDRPGNQSWVGEYAGKYLSAASAVWQYSHDSTLKRQMDRIVDILIACQKDDGYLGTYLPENYWLSWDVWSHKYNMIGLLAYYRATGYEPALLACRKMGDLLCRTFGKGEGKKNIVSSGAWFGLAACSIVDPMVELYVATGERAYLDFCAYVVDAFEQPDGYRLVSTLLNGGKINGIAGGKAYEMLSNLLGLAKLYRVQGDARLLHAVETGWTQVSNGRLYITGSTSSYEVFHDEQELPGGAESFVGEGCATTEWLHLSEELFRITGDAKYMDAVETTIYNHLLAAENPANGCVSYYTPLQGTRSFRSDIFGNCCLSSVPRGIASIPDAAITADSTGGISINLYSPVRADCPVRTADGSEISATCDIVTRYPEDGQISITLSASRKASFPVALRVPSWCTSFTANVGGKTYRGKPGSYLTMNRSWGASSVIDVQCEMTTTMIPGGKSYPNAVAVKRGPQVLALDAALLPGLKFPEKIRVNPSSVHVKPESRKLPADWVGSQCYSLTAKDENGKPLEIKLVPFADAGQTGGFVRVWLNRK